jgi:hypothetical protein
MWWLQELNRVMRRKEPGTPMLGSASISAAVTPCAQGFAGCKPVPAPERPFLGTAVHLPRWAERPTLTPWLGVPQLSVVCSG